MIKKGREEKHLVPNSSPNVKSLANVPAICSVFLSNDYSPMITVLDYSSPCHRWNDYCMWTLTLVKLTEISWKKRWATKIPNFPVTIQIILHYWWLTETEIKISHFMQLEIQNTWGVWEEIEEEIHTGWKGEAAESGLNAATFGLWVQCSVTTPLHCPCLCHNKDPDPQGCRQNTQDSQGHSKGDNSRPM